MHRVPLGEVLTYSQHGRLHSIEITLKDYSIVMKLERLCQACICTPSLKTYMLQALPGIGPFPADPEASVIRVSLVPKQEIKVADEATDVSMVLPPTIRVTDLSHSSPPGTNGNLKNKNFRDSAI